MMTKSNARARVSSSTSARLHADKGLSASGTSSPLRVTEDEQGKWTLERKRKRLRTVHANHGRDTGSEAEAEAAGKDRGGSRSSGEAEEEAEPAEE